jgi:hypothetical protein
MEEGKTAQWIRGKEQKDKRINNDKKNHYIEN